MACIGRCIDANVNFWITLGGEAFAGPQNNHANPQNNNQVVRLDRADVINLFPAQGEAGWEIPDIYHNDEEQALDIGDLGREQCEVVARHVAQDLFYDKLKLAGVVVLGVLASVAVIGVVAIFAEIIAELTIEIFISLGLLLMEWAGESILAYVATTGIVVLGIGTTAYELFNAYAAMLVGVAMIWTKVMVPNISRGSDYFHHRNNDLRRLEFQAVQAVPVAQNE